MLSGWSGPSSKQLRECEIFFLGGGAVGGGGRDEGSLS